jgi:hypothetical protein
MKISFALWWLLIALPGSAQNQAGSSANSIERNFAPGGKVTMQVSAGQYHIRPGASGDRIRLQWSAAKPEDMSKAQVKLEIRGTEAVISARGARDLRVDIEVPESVHIYANVGKGDIDIRDIDGDKDIRCRSGDITIHGSGTGYSRADLSVRLGDIEAPAFGVSKGGLWRSGHWQGNGKYSLNLRACLGSITVLER